MTTHATRAVGDFRAARLPALTLAVAALTLAGCRSNTPPVDDATLTSQVQQRIAGDSGLQNEPIQVIAQAGTVTLTGGVSNAAARSLAANDAAAIQGVQKVINDITVNPNVGPATATSTTPLPVAPTITQSTPRTRSSSSSRASSASDRGSYPSDTSPAPVTRTSAPPQQQAYNPPPPPAPSAPVARVVTLPAGTTLPIRVTQTLDSATAQPGDSFSGAVATDIVQDGMLLIPRGATATGRISEVHEAAHFKGSALLTVELTGVNARGERIAVSSQPYTVEGKGRGKNTAIKTGVGAAAGAVLGGIFGGGKGAAIGAAAGGGTGAGINAVTRGEQVQIPSETVVRFVTTNSIAVRTSIHAAGGSGDASLQNR